MPLSKLTVDRSDLTSSEKSVFPRTSLHQAFHYSKDQSLSDSEYQNHNSATITQYAMKGDHHLSKLKGLCFTENSSSSVNREKSHTQLNNDSSYSKDEESSPYIHADYQHSHSASARNKRLNPQPLSNSPIQISHSQFTCQLPTPSTRNNENNNHRFNFSVAIHPPQTLPFSPPPFSPDNSTISLIECPSHKRSRNDRDDCSSSTNYSPLSSPCGDQPTVLPVRPTHWRPWSLASS